MKKNSHISRITAWLHNSSLAANFVRLSSGSLGGQLLLILVAPILTRVYAPANFGVLGVFLSAMVLCLLSATLRYEMAIVATRNRVTPRYLYWLSNGLIVLFSLVTAIVLVCMVPLCESLPHGERLRTYAWLFPSALLIHGALQTTQWVAVKQKAFGRIGIAALVGRSADVAAKLLFGITFGLGASGLIFGLVIGDLVSLLMLVGTLREWNWSLPTRWKRYWALLRKYSDFPRYNLPASFGSALANGLPVAAYAVLFGPVCAGYLELSCRVLGRPSALLGNKLYMAFYEKSVDTLDRKGSIAGLIERILPILVLTTAGPFLIVGLSGEPLFTLIFGPEWSEAGRYAALLAPAWFLRSVASPIRVFNTVGRQDLGFRWQLVYLLLLLCAIGVGGALGGPYVVASWLSLAMCIAFGVHLGLTVRLSGASWRKILFTPCQIFPRPRDRITEASSPTP
ncbi:MAG: oligosaccharide flippase family protein [Planctomycetes bacterium]|nr:oligosaccharide flippase family protein [Planctomycetota bacterium]